MRGHLPGLHGPAHSPSPSTSAHTQSCITPHTPAPLYAPCSSCVCTQPEGSALYTLAHGGEGAWERWHEGVEERGILMPLAWALGGMEHTAQVEGVGRVGEPDWVGQPHRGMRWVGKMEEGREGRDILAPPARVQVLCHMGGGNQEGEPENGWAGPAVPQFSF
jgi:hypothetical protein